MAEIIHLNTRFKAQKTDEIYEDFIKEILIIAFNHYKKKKLGNKAEAVNNMLQNWNKPTWTQ